MVTQARTHLWHSARSGLGAPSAGLRQMPATAAGAGPEERRGAGVLQLSQVQVRLLQVCGECLRRMACRVGKERGRV